MDPMATGPRSDWRRLTACVLVFALVLQGIAFTLAGTRRPAYLIGAAGWELCRYDGGTAPGGAPESPVPDGHCMLCLAGANYLVAPAATSEFRSITFAVWPWWFAALRLPPADGNASAQPRGPPLIA